MPFFITRRAESTTQGHAVLKHQQVVVDEAAWSTREAAEDAARRRYGGTSACTIVEADDPAQAAYSVLGQPKPPEFGA
jgi:hypothetical protein